jgi:hypothetical protein
MSAPVITLIGGPSALIEANGFRLLTDLTARRRFIYRRHGLV